MVQMSQIQGKTLTQRCLASQSAKTESAVLTLFAKSPVVPARLVTVVTRMANASKMAVKRFVVIASVDPIQFVASLAAVVMLHTNAMTRANASASQIAMAVSAATIRNVACPVAVVMPHTNAMTRANASAGQIAKALSAATTRNVACPVGHVPPQHFAIPKACASVLKNVASAAAALIPFVVSRAVLVALVLVVI